MTDYVNPSIPLDAPIAERVELAAAHFGEAELISRAIGLLEGRNEGEEMLLFAGGRHAQGILDGAPALYWPELWGARIFLYRWDASAVASVISGMSNQAWRVREMCLRVCALRMVGDVPAFAARLSDPNARVRAAAIRAIAAVGAEADAAAVEPALRDRDIDVRRVAGEALKALRTA